MSVVSFCWPFKNVILVKGTGKVATIFAEGCEPTFGVLGFQTTRSVEAVTKALMQVGNFILVSNHQTHSVSWLVFKSWMILDVAFCF